MKKAMKKAERKLLKKIVRLLKKRAPFSDTLPREEFEKAIRDEQVVHTHLGPLRGRGPVFKVPLP